MNDKMDKGKFDSSRGLVIGVVGFGHLGRSLVTSLVQNGHPKSRILISHKGSERTCRAIGELGLGACVTDTRTLMGRADVVILAVRPQDVLGIADMRSKPGALVVSCMAGLSAGLLRTIFQTDVRRMMCSGPDTIAEGLGIATMYPQDARVETVLRMMGLRVHATASEEELDSFTIGICIPAMLQSVAVPEKEVKDAMTCMERTYPVYAPLYNWVREVLPDGAAPDGGASLAGVATKGGVTETMTGMLRLGAPFGLALQCGIERGREIAHDIRQSMSNLLKLAG